MTGQGPAEYFEDSLKLLDALNRSGVRDLFAGNIGRELSGDDIRAAFDRSFGAGAGQRVRVSCKNDGGRRLIVELTIGFRAASSRKATLPVTFWQLSRLTPAAPPALWTRWGCSSFPGSRAIRADS
jgi:ribonuclease I